MSSEKMPKEHLIYIRQVLVRIAQKREEWRSLEDLCSEADETD